MVSESAPAEQHCGECFRRLDEDAALAVADRTPCPACGSLARCPVVTIREDASPLVRNIREDLRVKAFEPGRRSKPFFDQKTGQEFFRKTGDWHQRNRIIDRRNDRYYEHIKDSEGEVVRHCEEPLTAHRGHGSAKSRSAKKTTGSS